MRVSWKQLQLSIEPPTQNPDWLIGQAAATIRRHDGGRNGPMSQPVAIEDLHQHLPEQIWYLSGDGRNLYCRRPYSFLFSTAEAAASFAKAFGVEQLNIVGIASKDVASGDFVAAFQTMSVTRLFIDPSIDPESGDVFGTILRLQEAN